MSRRRLLAVVTVIGLVTTVGVGSAIAGVGPASAVVDDVFGGEESQPPALLAFDTVGVHCSDDVVANSSTSIVAGGPNTEITYSRNVSLPGPSYALGGPTFERHNESTYVLSIPTEETGEAARECAGVARYEAAMRIPAGEDPWRVIVEHDEETVTTLFGDSNSSLGGGSVSAGGSASDA